MHAGPGSGGIGPALAGPPGAPGGWRVWFPPTRPRPQGSTRAHEFCQTPASIEAPTVEAVSSQAYLPVLEPECAPREVVDIYRDFQRRMGFPAAPNFIKTQGHSLAAAGGTWGLVQSILVGGVLPRTLKEMMFVAISHARGCRYCEAAHLACCRMLGIAMSELEMLVSNADNMSPPNVRDIILFGIKCAEAPQGLSREDFEGLRAHGLGSAEIMEVIAMAALAVYAHTIADATGMAADEMFGRP
jgi:uncharacterized peroxidase-related enzyme